MNTRKQVLLMSALLLMTLIVLGIYGAWYPSRETDAEEAFQERTAERAAVLFARNCRLCHGDVGEGGALGARLASAPALNRSDLQGFADSKATLSEDIDYLTTTVPVSDVAAFEAGDVILIEEERLEVASVGEGSLEVKRAVGHTQAGLHTKGASILLFNAQLLTAPDGKNKLITNTIMCGRVGTGMPPWGQSQGGVLSDEQMRQLTVLITQGRWDLVKEEVDREDRVPAKLLEPVTEDATFIHVSDVSQFSQGETIRLGDERLRLTVVTTLPKDAAGNLPKDRSGFIQVQRGVLKTTAQEHEETAVIYRFPLPAEPAILQSSCGQTARAPAPSGTPGLIEPFTGQTVEVVALGVAFNVKEITVKTDGQVRVRLDHQDTGVDHNIAFYKSSTDLTAVSSGSIGVIFTGPGIDDTAFDVPAAGEYFFRCDVHPTTMTGDFIVTQ